MSSAHLQTVKQQLVEAGFEIYRTRNGEIEIAERVRLHIMDSGVRIRVDDLVVTFTARSQRSDFPSVGADELFDKVRETIGQQATERGFTEEGCETVEVKDPVDEQRILDTWHEIVYTKKADSLDNAMEEVRWALSVEKCVSGG